MTRTIVLCLLLLAFGCSQSGPSPGTEVAEDISKKPLAEHPDTAHPPVDFDYWSTVFPLSPLEQTSGPRRFPTPASGDSLDRWKKMGESITSPAQLCKIELVRKAYAESRDLGPAVPVDIFLWSVDPPEKPYLTKLGGTPHRESTKPWPSSKGRPFTFVAQFCFADSRDIVSDKIPDDVMLIFFKNANALYEVDSVHVEWSSIELDSPLTADDCPAPSFTVPRLSGHIYRTNEYPASQEVFEQAGYRSGYLFATTQSTKIGRETFFTQLDPRGPEQELLCALNSIHPNRYPRGAKWPFIGLETLPDDWKQPDDEYEWGKYRMMFADVGCMYFLIDKQGRVTWTWDSY